LRKKGAWTSTQRTKGKKQSDTLGRKKVDAGVDQKCKEEANGQT